MSLASIISMVPIWCSCIRMKAWPSSSASWKSRRPCARPGPACGATDRQARFRSCFALAQQAIKLDPKRASPHMLAGEAFVAKGNAGDGVKELETARDIDPTVARAHWICFAPISLRGEKKMRNGRSRRLKNWVTRLAEPLWECGRQSARSSCAIKAAGKLRLRTEDYQKSSWAGHQGRVSCNRCQKLRRGLRLRLRRR